MTVKIMIILNFTFNFFKIINNDNTSVNYIKKNKKNDNRFINTDETI